MPKMWSMMNYKTMLETAKKAGVTNENKMWLSVENVSDLLDKLKHSHPDMYWEHMRNEHAIMYEGHYSEVFAMYDVSQMKWTDKEGKEHNGEYLSVSQVEEATKSMKFSPKVNKWDKYVAFNAFHADLCKGLTDAEILSAAYLFWFADEDYPDDRKIWDYFTMKYERPSD